MDVRQMQINAEGGENMRDISELHSSEIGEIVWKYRNGQSPLYIAKRLRVKLWQVDNFIKELRDRLKGEMT